MSKNIAIIGGGASAVLLLAHLARESHGSIDKIDVYDRAGAFGKGVAYSTANMAHPLNVRAANMSGYADVKDDLVTWLQKNEPAYDALSFIPRAVYGRYLSALLEDAKQSLPVRFMQEDVMTSKSISGGGYELSAGNNVRRYDEVILASGNVRPIAVQVDAACGVYHKSPYGIDYGAIPKESDIVVLGSGLSAVDAILGLEGAGFKGRIRVISTNGRFPARHAAPQVWEAMDAPLNNRSVADWMQAVRLYVARAEEGGLFWQTAIDSLRAQTNPFWHSLTVRQRDVFLRHALSVWNVHRHRMPPESADTIDRLKAQGRLEIVRDRAVSIMKDGKITCRACTVKGAGIIINGLGYRYDEGGRDYDVSYKIGPAAFGELFETTAIPEIRAQAYDIARQLTQ